ncbi:HNH endonuclease [Guyparkeria sp. TX1]|uniref:HNH endonuclease n=1 Tax=Guyparkeria sp. TX1 TaxID=3115001 RepID=UPI003977BEA6
MLVTSHIKPWRDSSDRERLDGDNGLFLASHVGRLFDQGLRRKSLPYGSEAGNNCLR